MELRPQPPVNAPWARFSMQIVDRETVTVTFATAWAQDEAAAQQRRAFFSQMVAAMKCVSVGQISFEGPPHKRWWVRGPAAAGYEIVSNFSQLGFCFSPDGLQRFFYGPSPAAKSQHDLPAESVASQQQTAPSLAALRHAPASAFTCSTTTPPSSPRALARGSITAVPRPLVASQVFIHSVTSHPQLNGRTAVVQHADGSDDDRWVVEVDGEQYSLPASKLQRVTGAPIEVLDSQPSPGRHARETPTCQKETAPATSAPAPPAPSSASARPLVDGYENEETVPATPAPAPPASSASASARPLVDGEENEDASLPAAPARRRKRLRQLVSSEEAHDLAEPAESVARAADEAPASAEAVERSVRPEPAVPGIRNQASDASLSTSEGTPVLNESSASAEPVGSSIRLETVGVEIQASEVARSTSEGTPELTEAAPSAEVVEQPIRPELAVHRVGHQVSEVGHSAMEETLVVTEAAGSAEVRERATSLQPAAPRVDTQASQVAQSTSSGAPVHSEAAAPAASSEIASDAAIRVGSQDSQSTHGGAPECSICMDAPVDTVFVPCGHMAACAACAKRLGKRPPCPVCRKKIKLVQQVFRA